MVNDKMGFQEASSGVGARKGNDVGEMSRPGGLTRAVASCPGLCSLRKEDTEVSNATQIGITALLRVIFVVTLS